jgi:hypothetical protein
VIEQNWRYVSNQLHDTYDRAPRSIPIDDGDSDADDYRQYSFETMTRGKNGPFICITVIRSFAHTKSVPTKGVEEP